PHTGLTELRTVTSMHERKQTMADLSDGFLALPGGIGTLEELTEIYTWAQLGLHGKPCGVLNVEGYFSSLLQFLDHAVHERFLRPEHRGTLLVGEDPGELLDRFYEYRAPRVGKWLDRAGT
ncbi:MAG TPA: TIGR00730 family Rossman fold protein, partial [Actinomycetota bacterium]|nr:TIGR00730 family Rossman fold protein [Actinomycetota bacterium]